MIKHGAGHRRRRRWSGADRDSPQLKRRTEATTRASRTAGKLDRHRRLGPAPAGRLTPRRTGGAVLRDTLVQTIEATSDQGRSLSCDACSARERGWRRTPQWRRPRRWRRSLRPCEVRRRSPGGPDIACGIRTMWYLGLGDAERLWSRYADALYQHLTARQRVRTMAVSAAGSALDRQFGTPAGAQ
jgi:hypothetical protein